MPPAAALAVTLNPPAFPFTRGVVRGIPERSRRTRLHIRTAVINALLGGGLACGAITELWGSRSSGRTAFAHALVASVLAGGECAAWIDLPNAFDPEHARTAGVALERLLWAHPIDPLTAFRATESVIAAGGFRLVVLDLDDPSRPPVRLPTSTWLRVTRAAIRHDAAVVVLSPTHVAGTFAAVALEVSVSRHVFVGVDGPACVFAGITSAFHLQKNKLGPPGAAAVDLFVSTAA